MAKIEFYLICARLTFTPIKVQQEAVSEVIMRIVVVVFAALMTLGLVAFGVVVAQKATDPVPVRAAAARVSSSQNAVAAAGGEKAPLHLAEATKAAAPFVPTAVAQNNTVAVAPAFPAPAPVPKPVAACITPRRSGSHESLRLIRQVALRSEPSISNNMISYAIRKLL
jgi:hypothetical protein